MRIRRQEQLAAEVRECSELLRAGNGGRPDVADRLAAIEEEMLEGIHHLPSVHPHMPPQVVRRWTIVRQRTWSIGNRTWTIPGRSWTWAAAGWSGRLHELRRVVRGWTTPRLGRLVHHDPVPLTVPARYLRARPPADPPLISIVTPSYNQADYLDRTIASVVGQRYPRLEYRVQDAASTDATRDVLERWNGQVDWVSEPDRGQADGINRGLARTAGEIMAYLNSDDLLLPGALAVVARYFRDHPDVDAVYGHRVLIDGDDCQIGSWIVPRHDDETLRWADFVPQETLFWRRSIWERVGGCLDDSLAYALDWDLLLRFLDAGAQIHRIPRFLGAFRVHETQKTTANASVGEREVALLRERSFGRPVTQDEVMAHVARYLRRHIVAHGVQRAREALHVERLRVAEHYETRAAAAQPALRAH